MGVTGSGKSTFISTLTGWAAAQVGHTLDSCKSRPTFGRRYYLSDSGTGTTKVGIHPYADPSSGRRIVLIDTPGFDDTTRSDAEVLKTIVAFLTSLYLRGVRLAGIAYLHRITDTRVQGSAVKSLNILELLCGAEAMRGVTFVTTMWEQLPEPEVGVRRETELMGKSFWGRMVTREGQVMRHPGDKESAEEVVRRMVCEARANGSVVLEIQREMVDCQKALNDTAAGAFVTREMREAQRRHEAEVAEYRAAIREAEQGARETAEELQREMAELEASGVRRLKDLSGLRISLPELVGEQRATVLGRLSSSSSSGVGTTVSSRGGHERQFSSKA